MGFQKPSKIQERALPLLLQNPFVQFRFFLVSTRGITYSFRQAEEYDRTISVRNGKDGCVCLDDAIASKYGFARTSGESSIELIARTEKLIRVTAGYLYRSFERTGAADYVSGNANGRIYAREMLLRWT